MIGRRARAFAAAAGLGVAVAATPSLGGVVVLKNGEVFVGRVPADQDTQESLVVRWPYKERTDRGEMTIPKFRIRWYDRDADKPTDAYWKQFENDQIDSAWHPERERWRMRQRTEEDDTNYLPLDAFDQPRGTLSPVPVVTRDFQIRKPDKWTSRTEDGITIFESDQPGVDGFRPRIHIYSVPSVPGSVEPQIGWLRGVYTRFTANGKLDDTRGDMGRLKPVKKGFDQEMLTVIPRKDSSVFVLRMVAFREKRTCVFNAYADERDYSGLEILFKNCMRTLALSEDEVKPPAGGAGGSATPPAPPPPVEAPR